MATTSAGTGAAPTGPSDHPSRLSRRDWGSVGRQHLAMYRSLLAGQREGAERVRPTTVDQPVSVG